MHGNLLKTHTFFCTLNGTHQETLMNTIHVKHDIGNRFNEGQGQNKIGGVHLHHVNTAIHA